MTIYTDKKETGRSGNEILSSWKRLLAGWLAGKRELHG